MGVTVSWFNDEQTILWYEMVGNWSWDEFYPAYYEAIAMEKSVDHMVDIIVDMRQSVALPPNSLTHLRSISDKQPENVGLSVIVTEHRLVNIIVATGTRVYQKIAHYFQVVPTLDEALQRIEAARTERDLSRS